MSPTNSYPIKYDLVEIDRDYKYDLVEIDRDYVVYRKGSLWADPDIESAARAMRSVYDDYDAALKIGEIAARDMKERFSPKVIGDRIRRRLQSIS